MFWIKQDKVYATWGQQVALGQIGCYAYKRHTHQCLGCDLAKIFLTSKFSYLDFCNPTHKTETQAAHMWELLIANHQDKSLCLANQKQGAVVRSYLSASANRQE
jgi:hypothetical protein